MKKLFYTLFLPFLLCSCSSLFEPDHAQVELNVNSIARELETKTEFSDYIIQCNLISDSEEWRKNEREMDFFKTVALSKDDINAQKSTSFKFTGIPMGINLQAYVFISGQIGTDRITLYSGESQTVTVDSTKIKLNVELTRCDGEVTGTVNEIPELTIGYKGLEQITIEEPAEASYPVFAVSDGNSDDYTLEFKANPFVSDSAVYEWILNGNILDAKSSSFTLDCLTNEYVNYSEEGGLNTLIVVVTDGTQSKSAQIQFVLNYVEGQ